jgi:hypothetical protein
MGLDSVGKFHAQFYKFVKIHRLIGLVYETSLEFLRDPSFESSLLHLGVIIQNHY